MCARDVTSPGHTPVRSPLTRTGGSWPPRGSRRPAAGNKRDPLRDINFIWYLVMDRLRDAKAASIQPSHRRRVEMPVASYVQDENCSDHSTCSPLRRNVRPLVGFHMGHLDQVGEERLFDLLCPRH